MFRHIRSFFQNNRICIKIYSVLRWHERIFSIKKWKDENKDFIFKINDKKTSFFLPFYKEDFIQKEILRTNNFYESDYLEEITQKWNNGIIGQSIENGLILDIGANIGNHAIYFLQILKASMVYCFEPVENTFEILRRNILLNSLSKKTKLFNVGIGESKGFAEIKSYTKSNIGSTTIEKKVNGNISLISIDSLKISKKISFVKIDVEGFEVNVLKGMKDTLSKNKPCIMIEIRDENLNEADKILKELGYTSHQFNHEYDYGNFLYIPE